MTLEWQLLDAWPSDAGHEGGASASGSQPVESELEQELARCLEDLEACLLPQPEPLPAADPSGGTSGQPLLLPPPPPLFITGAATVQRSAADGDAVSGVPDEAFEAQGGGCLAWMGWSAPPAAAGAASGSWPWSMRRVAVLWVDGRISAVVLVQIYGAALALVGRPEWTRVGPL
ncbi:hypothetical protein GPECTOR_5g325 [Gonium pectorale]|uniref:Uncharacterized protein n=1 Tax=Gonium pectorale TaxID=33097 RepID=A0A150GWQ1_GONPE|nr:hypothetical protein GPECTOR_5g325 [Gonium pectorale]|eukprot:KXZ54234.1 hypothetical protein GPECTOR_5g325 [Gonium pectorale]